MNQNKVGTEQNLKDRIGSSNSGSVLLVRAINDYELEQLLKDGQDSFLFHEGTNYETDYGSMVKREAFLRNGTIIVYDTHRLIPSESNFEMHLAVDAFTCTKRFRAPVEVYNIHGSCWDDLARHPAQENPLAKYLILK